MHLAHGPEREDVRACACEPRRFTCRCTRRGTQTQETASPAQTKPKDQREHMGHIVTVDAARHTGHAGAQDHTHSQSTDERSRATASTETTRRGGAQTTCPLNAQVLSESSKSERQAVRGQERRAVADHELVVIGRGRADRAADKVAHPVDRLVRRAVLRRR